MQKLALVIAALITSLMSMAHEGNMSVHQRNNVPLGQRTETYTTVPIRRIKKEMKPSMDGHLQMVRNSVLGYTSKRELSIWVHRMTRQHRDRR
ncbi:hypothetical protein [Sediminicola sp. 1XM1-17]|uniref:hypothetical protein n=1 Tax=Sediminicola sp. 1XM1-17 TaxID=3127702 RepID=UPI003076E951